MPGRPVEALIVEDVEDDIALIVLELATAGFDLHYARATSSEEFEAELAHTKWDVVLCGDALAHLSAFDAFAILKKKALDIPFIVLSRSLGERAIEAFHAGMQDWVVKNRLARLPIAIERAQRQRAEREELQRVREQLMLSDRMASVGMLASGVAHEINNPLAVISANSEILEREIEALRSARREDASAILGKFAADASELIKDTREATERVRLIVRDLRIFSRADDEKWTPVDVEQVIDSTIRIARNELRHRARITKVYGSVPRIEAGESQLGQAILNLLINAAHAIREGEADKNEIKVTTSLDRESNVVIEIRDTGPGYTPETMARLFDPFFSTTAAGTGTGLYMAQRIIRSFGGVVFADSEIGRGSTFRVLLPAMKTALRAPAPKIGPGPQPKRRAQILIIDGERIAGTALARLIGTRYETMVETSAKAALTRIQEGRRFDLILCDLMMPVMTGIELFEALESLAPDQAERVVFMTGGAFTEQARAFLASVANPRLEKPIQPERLFALINERLA